VQMTCDDCHRLSGLDEPWPYQAVAATTIHSTGNAGRRSQTVMAPIQFATHCSGCHTLQFDRRFADLQVPHDRTEVVHAMVTKQFEQYIAAHPAAVHETEPLNRQLPERIRLRPAARNSSEWVQFRVEEAESLLWTKTCKQCHVVLGSGNALPEVAKANITERWLPNAEFDHRMHRMMSCVSCHGNATNSHDTSDVLLPGIQTCQQCHQPSATKDAAESRCFECHQYHDWTKAKRTKGKFSIPELRGTAELHSPN
jgi:hypothetical protein